MHPSIQNPGRSTWTRQTLIRLKRQTRRACFSAFAAVLRWGRRSVVHVAEPAVVSPAANSSPNLCLLAFRSVPLNQPSVHFSSRSEEWETPLDVFNELNQSFQFNLDACATSENAKCARYFTKEQNALEQHWSGRVWMNPPYGRQIEAFMRKAYAESQKGATVVCLVPSRTDTRWWHRYAKRGVVLSLKGRLHFGRSKSSAPFPSSVVIFFPGRLGAAVIPTSLGEAP